MATATQPLGLSGKLLLAGALVGLIALFLPACSVSMDVAGQASFRNSAMGVEFWQGKVGIVAYLAVGLLTFLLTKPVAKDSSYRNRLFGLLGASAMALILAIYLFVDASSSGRSFVIGGTTGSGGAGIGAYLNALAGIVSAAGAVLKAKEVQLVQGRSASWHSDMSRFGNAQASPWRDAWPSPTVDTRPPHHILSICVGPPVRFRADGTRHP